MPSSLEEELVRLQEAKGKESDQRELRRIRKKIRDVKRKLGTYEPRERASLKGMDSEERAEHRRQQKERRDEEYSRIYGAKVLNFWEAQPKLHGPLCLCSKCAMKRKANQNPPPLREWAGILRANGLEIPNGWTRKAFKRIRQGEKPKTKQGRLLESLMLVSGW